MEELIRVSIICIAILSLGCGPSQEEIDIIVQTEYDKRVLELKSQERLKCQKEALAVAELVTDSIILSLRLNPIPDTLYNPGKPAKPTFIATDTTLLNIEQSVKPILKGY